MLAKLREKPDHIKKNISLVLTIIIFSVILFVWMSSRDARSRGEETRKKTVSPLTGFMTMFGGFMPETRVGVPNTPSYVENTPAVATTTTASPEFDLSGVVVIDLSTTTTADASTSAR